MSNFVNEIVEDLENNPHSWFVANTEDSTAIERTEDNILIQGYGNGRLLSLIDVYINDNCIPISYSDKWKLEVAMKKWYREINLNHLLKSK